ncbi:MAG: hypothetical protein IPM54_36925 [Polyangiaceae bacterium]|nr:hypothetical protein [Polyangiaceae bacterium]
MNSKKTFGMIALSVTLGTGCSRAPAEPEPTSTSAPAAPAVAPLQWTVPSSWTTMDVPRSGPQKAGYRIPQVGNDKEEATLEVFFFGTGAEGSPDKHFQSWFKQFDGDVEKTAKREKFSAGALEVEMIEISGTYKIPLGPPVGPKKKAPMQMVKENFRLLGAVVKTPDRGNWFFKLAGPSDTVEAARGAWKTVLESAK